MGLGETLRNAMDKIQGSGIVDEKTVKEAIKEMQRGLIGANVEPTTVFEVSKKIEEKAFEKLTGTISRREYIVKIAYDSLAEMLGGKKAPEDPKRILLCGLFGSGKTTASGKLGVYYKKRGKKIGLIGCDTYRPAAYEQLETNAKKAGVDFFGIKKEKNAEKIVKEGMKKFKDYDLIICDTAGRSGLDKELIEEIQKIQEVIKADEKILVLPADIGNLAKKQASAFHKNLGVTGVIITKMDGSSKGGGAIVATKETGASVYFISTGEKLDEFEEFDSQRYLSRIMGYGDLQGLLEKAKEAEVENLDPTKILNGEMNFKVFYQQLVATKKMGSLSKVAGMLGLGMKMPKDMLDMGQEKLDGFKVIIDSMTEQERLQPELMNRSRIERIAKGAGKNEKEIRTLLKQFKQMKKMFKKFKGFGSEKAIKKMGEKDLTKMMQQMQGKKAMKKKFRLK